jgi:hypothetical protein
MFKPFTQTKVIVPDHPHARPRNWLGGLEDIADHQWIHHNVRVTGTEAQYAPIKDAFRTYIPMPFDALGWNAPANCPTKTVSRWHYADCPVSDALMISFETHKNSPVDFFNYLSRTYNLPVSVELFHPQKSTCSHLTFNPKE